MSAAKSGSVAPYFAPLNAGYALNHPTGERVLPRTHLPPPRRPRTMPPIQIGDRSWIIF